MKKHLFLFFISLVCFGNVNAQLFQDSKLELPDKNDFDFLTDQRFNDDRNGILYDYIFIKSCIGINLDSIPENNFGPISDPPYTIKGTNGQDTLLVTKVSRQHPVVINGVAYDRIVNTFYGDGREVELVSLDEIKTMYYPEAKDPCMFMVNKFFLTNDLQSYKFDKDFILKVEMLKSTEFENFKNFPDFTILRIFTKTRKNLQDQQNAYRLR